MHRIVTIGRKRAAACLLGLLFIAAVGYWLRWQSKPAVPAETIRLAVESCLAEVTAKFAPDPRTTVFQIAYELQGGTLEVTGEVMTEEQNQALTEALRSVPGVRRVNNRAVTLPLLPESDKTAGIVVATVTNLYREPDPSGDIVTQAVLGEVLSLLEKDKGLFLVQQENGYLGWILAGDLQAVTAADKEEYQRRINRIVVSSLAPLYQSPDVNSPVILNAVAPSYLAAGTAQADWLPVTLPDGRQVWVLSKHTQETVYPFRPSGRGTTVGGDGRGIAAQAAGFLGVPYFWGGTSPLGIDCSGFTQMIYRLAGVLLPRDADQQYAVGVEVAKATLQPGDLVFFGSAQAGGAAVKPNHVGIYIGDGKFIHASTVNGKVKTGNLSNADPECNPGTNSIYLGARRIVGSSGQ